MTSSLFLFRTILEYNNTCWVINLVYHFRKTTYTCDMQHTQKELGQNVIAHCRKCEKYYVIVSSKHLDLKKTWRVLWR